jgi:hypothetical protein
LKIDDINYIVNNVPEYIKKSSYDIVFINEIQSILKRYDGNNNHFHKNIITHIKSFFEQKSIQNENFNPFPTSISNATHHIINQFKLMLNNEEYEESLKKDNPKFLQSFSKSAFDKIFSSRVNLIAYRGDSRSPQEIFKTGFIPRQKNSNSSFMMKPFDSGGAAISLTSDFKAASYFPFSLDRGFCGSGITYIYICKVRKSFNTCAEHYKKFVMERSQIPSFYKIGLRLCELSTDGVEAEDVYAAFKIQRSNYDIFGLINTDNEVFPKGREFVI